MAYEERPVEMPPEWGGVIPSEVFLSEAVKIVEKAKERDLIIRVMGGVAIRIHSSNKNDLAAGLGRMAVGVQEFTDLDFMSYRRFRDRMKGFFEELGYAKRRATLSSAASERQIYFHPKGWFFIDVFYDRLLVANHPLDFRRRLELESITIPVTDLLLEKLQIVTMGEKDAKDSILLLSAHELGDRPDNESVDSEYIAKLLAKDWGFYYTVTTNLRGLRDIASSLPAVSDEERRDVISKATKLLDRIEQEPKTSGWKLRAMVGPRKRWYEVVETTETAGEFGIWRLLEKKNSHDRRN